MKRSSLLLFACVLGFVSTEAMAYTEADLRNCMTRGFHVGDGAEDAPAGLSRSECISLLNRHERYGVKGKRLT